MDVDTVLMRPCPKFPLMCRLLPTYLLSDNSPEGHAVVLMKVGGVKDLCDAIFQTPEGEAALQWLWYSCERCAAASTCNKQHHVHTTAVVLMIWQLLVSAGGCNLQQRLEFLLQEHMDGSGVRIVFVVPSSGCAD